jgi:hypothetical protein
MTSGELRPQLISAPVNRTPFHFPQIEVGVAVRRFGVNGPYIRRTLPTQSVA